MTANTLSLDTQKPSDLNIARPLPKQISSMWISALISKKWSYAKQTISLTRNLFNSIANVDSRFSRKVGPLLKGTATRLKLISIISVSASIPLIAPELRGIEDAIRWKDPQGTLLSSLSFSLVIGDMFDSLTTFVNTTLEVLHLSKVQWISKIGLPFALSLATLSIISKSRRLYQLSTFNRTFKRDIMKKSTDSPISEKDMRQRLTPFLEKYLGTEGAFSKNKNTLSKEAKIATLNRNLSKEFTSELLKMSALLECSSPLSKEQLHQLNDSIQSIDHLLTKEKLIQPLSLVASLISGIALLLFFTFAPPALPFALLATSLALQIGLKLKEDLYSVQRLELPVKNEPRMALAVSSSSSLPD